MGQYNENDNNINDNIIFTDDEMPELIQDDYDDLPELEYGSPMNPAEDEIIINNDEIPNFRLPNLDFNNDLRILNERPYFLSRVIHYNLRPTPQYNLLPDTQANLPWNLQPDLPWNVQPNLQWNLQPNLQPDDNINQ